MRALRHLLSLLLGPSLLVAGLLCAAAALAAQFGRHSDLCDLFTHFAALYLAWGALMVLAGLAAQGWVRRPLVITGVVVVGASIALIAPEYLRDTGPRAGADAPRQLKLIQFNVWGEENQDIRGTIDWIIAQQPDVVAVEESTPAFADLLIARTGWHVSCLHCEDMIFSKEAPVSVDIPTRPDNASRAPVARASFRDARGDYTVIAVHATWPVPGPKQHHEGDVLAAIVAGFPQDGLIMAGDFNSTPWSFTRWRQDQAFRLPRRERALFSWPARLAVPRYRGVVPLPVLPIDHVYAAQDWATVRIARGPRLGSDHYPLIVTLARRASPQAARPTPPARAPG